MRYTLKHAGEALPCIWFTVEFLMNHATLPGEGQEDKYSFQTMSCEYLALHSALQ